jgi:hypothetical protein
MYFLRQDGCFSLFLSIPGRPLTIWKGSRKVKRIGLSNAIALTSFVQLSRHEHLGISRRIASHALFLGFSRSLDYCCHGAVYDRHGGCEYPAFSTKSIGQNVKDCVEEPPKEALVVESAHAAGAKRRRESTTILVTTG